MQQEPLKSMYEVDKFISLNDFGLFSLKMHVFLVQQGLLKLGKMNPRPWLRMIGKCCWRRLIIQLFWVLVTRC